MKIRVNNVQRCCLHDGPGIRTTVFLQGCPLRCWWCHNPETRAAESADMREVEAAELVKELERDAAYWAESGGGVTLSGGEPLLQAPAVLELAEVLWGENHHLAIDTCGAGALEDVRTLNDLASLWLWDLKAVSPELAERGTGSDAQAALENLAWLLDETGSLVVIRVPLIAGFNADPEELGRLAAWLNERRRKVPVEILPGHAHGVDPQSAPDHRPRRRPRPRPRTPEPTAEDEDRSLRSLGTRTRTMGRLVPSETELETALEIFRRAGLTVSSATRRRR